uniref:Uncharacterized protein n=1 Tax=Trieres chinensis TaxID=1514140 RepID=A0A7S2E9I2_TRICV|mmetsp:Transcript_1376/g.2935  ORF Transcript_1376/g.2935 Transcript_1376/m.2935 type:complete len:120 (+) Transcript_1376:143-502(+)|eukprot:CAMPEP_0183298538 /NCGR_PEP_ID=MMETSP0160_2-20130417/5526_1 /TAXON_ID=2839 ORGANISM="Odontella Sinensis, Strain Grunow 1884" /NCGR_SAMPLE_ID=MMETSP0160_2 /ASSEMBLY_ACC=CAM_ASM_000250 /LENGTH=119 /DNA_ID=CAMNT_0025460593 /DNA_START=46 /DNA_END=408 /DNA_ORIENTATION=-
MKLTVFSIVGVLLLISAAGASLASDSIVGADEGLGGSVSELAKPEGNRHGRQTQTVDPYSCSQARKCCKCSDNNCSDLTLAKKYKKCIRKNCKARCGKAAKKCYGDKGLVTKVAVDECW